ncbi:MAG: hypothetical protein AAF962_02590 [Actinomycetota bacterium]
MLLSRHPATPTRGVALVAAIALLLAACGGETATDAAEPATATDQEPGSPTTGADTAAPAGALTNENVLALLGSTTDVSGTVSALGAFPAFPTPPDAEIVHVSSRTFDGGGTVVDRVGVRYLTTIDTNELVAFFDSAAAAAGWEAIPGDTSFYGGTSTLFVSEYDIPGVGADDAPEIEVVAERWDETQTEISIRSELAAVGGLERYDRLLDPVPLPDGRLSILDVGFGATAVPEGVRSTRRVTVTYPTEVAALQDQIVGLVGSPTLVTPVDPGPGVVEAQAVGAVDLLRYESWTGLYGSGDTSTVASSVVVDAEWTTTG